MSGMGMVGRWAGASLAVAINRVALNAGGTVGAQVSEAVQASRRCVGSAWLSLLSEATDRKVGYERTWLAQLRQNEAPR
jgi:hypothetical protein